MKRIFVLLLAVSFVLGGVAMAARVSPIPAVGIAAQGSTADFPGKIGQGPNGDWYRYVKNGAATAEAADPAFFTSNVSGYPTVAKMSATSQLMQFAGVWYCDLNGNSTVQPNVYGWIQIAGIASCEVNVAVTIGDILVGSNTNAYLVTAYAAPTSGTTTESLFANVIAAQTNWSSTNIRAVYLKGLL